MTSKTKETMRSLVAQELEDKMRDVKIETTRGERSSRSFGEREQGPPGHEGMDTVRAGFENTKQDATSWVKRIEGARDTSQHALGLSVF
ncbi:hypothetical protein CERZMDRAFT_99242 [Cercospora zeae-maydis SCOH1-5]|uniref:Uncharacterized protein n=1 Tax=Cercospora zeae-maydis SCOH1-5 TaxID=717836 RepID=A0A6A6FBA1_9PEZI|nr:hypothetical protein CERZMDRAFT_99242 [Cercospora zeae-maydis SCOH1-5]